MSDDATPAKVRLTDGLGPDGKLHMDGYFTWHRRDGYVLDAKLPSEFVLAEKVRAVVDRAVAAEGERLRSLVGAMWDEYKEQHRSYRTDYQDGYLDALNFAEQGLCAAITAVSPKAAPGWHEDDDVPTRHPRA